MNTLKPKSNPKTFLAINFGCRVNAAETNQWSQSLINQGFIPFKNKTCNHKLTTPTVFFVNTCSVTKKGEKESLNKIKSLNKRYPKAKIITTGCANLSKIKNLKNIFIFTNQNKEIILSKLKSSYSPKINDKYTKTNRYLLKIQSGCTQFCSYCIVPFKRKYLFSLPLIEAINTVNKAIKDGYQEVILTGVNIDEYQYGLSILIKELLEKTKIKLISFGSIPINCLNDDFIGLYQNPQFKNRLSFFLHIPIQSGSNKILKLMNRPYTVKTIKNKFAKLKKEENKLTFGTDIIVGYPTENEKDFQDTLKICQEIGFSKIHVFKFSPRPGTKARILFENSQKISKITLKDRSTKIKKLEITT